MSRKLRNEIDNLEYENSLLRSQANEQKWRAWQEYHGRRAAYIAHQEMMEKEFVMLRRRAAMIDASRQEGKEQKEQMDEALRSIIQEQKEQKEQMDEVFRSVINRVTQSMSPEQRKHFLDDLKQKYGFTP